MTLCNYFIYLGFGVLICKTGIVTIQDCDEALTENYVEPFYRAYYRIGAALGESEIIDGLCLQGASITVEEK